MEAAEWVEKVRINPGNFVDNKRFAVKEYTDAEYAAELERIEERFTPPGRKAQAPQAGPAHRDQPRLAFGPYHEPLRRFPLGMVESALEFTAHMREERLPRHHLLHEASNPKVMIEALSPAGRAAGRRMGMDYPFHLGVTEAGDGEDGRIKSAIGIGSLLEDGIGDTIRVSLTEDPELEIPVCAALAGAI